MAVQIQQNELWEVITQLKTKVEEQAAEIAALRQLLNTPPTSTVTPEPAKLSATTSRRRMLKRAAGGVAAFSALAVGASINGSALAQTAPVEDNAIEGTAGAVGYGGKFSDGIAPVRLVPAATANAPTSGSHLPGELYVDSSGTLFYCTKAGAPGSWVKINNPLVAGSGITLTPNTDGTTTVASSGGGGSGATASYGLTAAPTTTSPFMPPTGQKFGVIGVTSNQNVLYNGNDIGVLGFSPDGVGVSGNSRNNTGVYGFSETKNAVSGFTSNGFYGGAFGAGENAKAPLLLAPSTTTGAPKTNTHFKGELYTSTESDKSSNLYFCTSGDGTNLGTWVKLNSTINSLSSDITIQQNGSPVPTEGQNINLTSVTTLNGLAGSIDIQVNGTTIKPNGQTINIITTGGSGGGVAGVSSIKGVDGAVELEGGTGIQIPAPTGKKITINNSGITALTANNGQPLTGTVNLVAGNNIAFKLAGNTITIEGTASGTGNNNTPTPTPTTTPTLTATPTVTATPTPATTPATNFFSTPIRVALVIATDANALKADGGANPTVTTLRDIQITEATDIGGSKQTVPRGAKAIIATLTSVGATSSGNLRVWPSGGAIPSTISLNIPARPDNSGFNLCTAVIVGLSSAGKLSIGFCGKAGAQSGYALDISGYIM